MELRGRTGVAERAGADGRVHVPWASEDGGRVKGAVSGDVREEDGGLIRRGPEKDVRDRTDGGNRRFRKADGAWD